MNTEGKYRMLARPGLRKNFRDRYDLWETKEYTNFLRTDSLDSPEIAASIMTGINRLIEIGDGESVSFDSPVLGPKVAATYKEFGAGILISKRTIDDDQYGKMKQAAMWLADAAQLTKEYRAAGFLDDAFTGTLYKGIDQKSICATDHTFLNGTGTWSNAVANPTQLSVAGFQACMDLFLVTKDHNGDPKKMWPTALIIGNNTGDWHRALQILKSAKEPDTANNADNAFRTTLGGLGEPKMSRYKTSSKSYFMIDQKYNDAWFLTRRDAEVEDERDFKTGAYLWKSTMSFLIWFVDPRGWVGSNPS